MLGKGTLEKSALNSGFPLPFPCVFVHCRSRSTARFSSHDPQGLATVTSSTVVSVGIYLRYEQLQLTAGVFFSLHLVSAIIPQDGRDDC